MGARESRSRVLPASPFLGVSARSSGSARVRRAVLAVGWWALLATCLLHAGFALAMAGAEVTSWLGVGPAAKARGATAAFVLHAVTGAVGSVLAAPPPQRWLTLHRRLGRVYAWAAWITSVASVSITAAFQIAVAAKVMFWVLSVLWCLTTTITVHRARQGDRRSHEQWAVRSVSLTLFFVTFNPWVSGLEALGYSRDASYTLGVFLSWGLNLLAAEAWIRARQAPARGDGALPPALFLAALLLQGVLAYVWPWRALVPDGWRLVGLLPLAAGLALNVTQSSAFRRRGIPIHPRATPTALRIEGPYRWTRNPMYLGMVLALSGAALLLGAATAMLVAPAFGWLLARRFIHAEERALAARFGAEYEAYRRRVRRWL
jgi:protein-S-isoprenylcysteine O-methyltransferase Ste14